MRVFFIPLFVLSLLLPSMLSTPLFAQGTLYLSDVIGGAEPDPAFAQDGYKTKRDVLPSVVGRETWVGHYLRGDEEIETLTYNQLVYGIVVRKKDGTTEYYTLNDDRKTYSLSRNITAEGWTLSQPSADDFLDSAKKHIHADRYKKAIEVLEEAIEDYGYRTAEAYFFLGYCYDTLAETELAKYNYKEALERDPAIPDALYNLGILLRDEGKHTEAVRYLKRYLVLVPDSPSADSIKEYINIYQ
jgi:tetratricopeptide (TPR) repeat protein